AAATTTESGLVVTMVGPAHLVELDGIDGVAREKARLLEGVRPGGFAVYPKSCDGYESFRRLPVRGIAVGFGLRPRSDSIGIVLGGDEAAGEFTLPSPSEGMASNAALALELALRLGLPAETLRARLAGWRPAPGRGEIRREPGRLLYLDHYNANPASMDDALAAFRRLAPEALPRLYVLGGMEELGADEDRFHRELGASLRLRPEDRLFFVGPQGPSVRDGALAAGARPGQIELAASAAGGAALLAAFRGAILVKGSRRHRLEDAFAATEASVPC
ncbi:MAG: glutamate ligase domain-containing protein, partial [Opitutaceae bacterium]